MKNPSIKSKLQIVNNNLDFVNKRIFTINGHIVNKLIHPLEVAKAKGALSAYKSMKLYLENKKIKLEKYEKNT